MNKLIVGALLGASLVTGAVARPPADPGTPAQIARLLACRALGDGAQRLACFDRETGTMATAISAKDLVVVDRERVREARKGLFGFSVPSFGGLFGGGDDDDSKRLVGSVAAAGRNADGGWTVRLDDGSVWTQTDDSTVALAPRKGMKIVIDRAALGSFKLSIGGQPSVRAKRIG